MRHRPHEAQLVHLLGEPRQVLANLNARDAGGDRPKLAANLGRCLRFHVPQVDLTRAAEQEQEDACLGPRRPLAGVQDGYNRKGLLSEKGEPKQAFFVLRDYYRGKAGEAGGPR